MTSYKGVKSTLDSYFVCRENILYSSRHRLGDTITRLANPTDKCIPMGHTHAYERDERYMPMRTTLNIEDTLVERASELTGIKEKTMLVKLGLEALIARESARRLAKLGGTERKLKTIPRRRIAEQ